MTEYKNLELDYRMYQYLRSNAITNLYDALVELITNCVDAYRHLDKNKVIDIYFNATNRTLTVIDQAVGLNAEKMENAFLTVGKYLSDDISRGHFSRGAKDISAIADITFTAIKNNKLSQCKILNNGTGAMIIKDKEISNERDIYKIKENGLHVKLDLIKTLSLEIDWDKLCKHYALRDILANEKIIISLHVDNNIKILKYNFPDNLEKIVSVDYQVPYYNVPAKFVVYIDRNNSLYLDDSYYFSENGFLIKSFNTIYENSNLNNRFIYRHQKFHQLIGYIECDYLNNLLKDYELNGPTEQNPLPIIDTSRLTGINKSHPFTKHLLRLPQERVLHILSELQYESTNMKTKFNLTKLLASLHDIQILGSEIFDKLNVELLSQFFFQQDELPPIVLNDVQHTGKEEELLFSKNNINKRRSNKKNDLNELLRTGAKLDINFVEKNFNGKFKTDITSTGITINIPLENSVVKRYLGTEEEDFPGKNDTRFLITLADIITESFANILALNEQGKIDNTNLSNQDVIDIYNDNYDKFYDMYEEKIYNAILG